MKAKQIITIPRIIGIIAIAIAIWAVTLNQYIQASFLGAAGLILALTKNKPAKRYWTEFAKSWKLGKKWVIISLFDAVFWAVFTILSGLLVYLVGRQMEALKTLSSPQTLGAGIAEAQITVIKSVLTNSLMIFIVFLLASVLVYSLCRGFIWLRIFSKPLKFVYFAKFLLLNIIWMIIVLGLILFASTVIYRGVGAVIALIIFLLSIHITTCLHFSFTKTRKIWQSIGKALKIGISKITRFGHLYCYAFIVLVIIQQIFRLRLESKLLILIAMLLLILYSAWYRLYMYTVLKKV